MFHRRPARVTAMVTCTLPVVRKILWACVRVFIPISIAHVMPLSRTQKKCTQINGLRTWGDVHTLNMRVHTTMIHKKPRHMDRAQK